MRLHAAHNLLCHRVTQVLREAAERLSDLKASDSGLGKDELPRVQTQHPLSPCSPLFRRHFITYPIFCLILRLITPNFQALEEQRLRHEAEFEAYRKKAMVRASSSRSRARFHRRPSALTVKAS